METVSVFQREWESNMRTDVLMTFIRESAEKERYDDESSAPPPVPKGLFHYTLVEGWVSKRGDVNQGWKRRYFRAVVLEGGDVRVSYHADAEGGTPALGLLPCADCEALAFGPLDYAEILRQEDAAGGCELAPAAGEREVWYGIKVVPADVYNPEGRRVWWLSVGTKEEQVQWVEALRLLTRVAVPVSAPPVRPRRSSMASIFRESESAPRNARLSTAVALPTGVTDESGYMRMLRRVFASTYIRTRKYFSIDSIVLSQLRYPPASEPRLLEESLEPVLKREIFDRMPAPGSGGARRPSTTKSAGSKDERRGSELFLAERARLLDDINWCILRGLPPLPLQQPYQRLLTSKQHAAAGTIVQPAAQNLWQAMQAWTKENYMQLHSQARNERAELLELRKVLLDAMKLSTDPAVAVATALACATGGEEPAASDVGAYLALICKFFHGAAPILAALQDATFDGLCQACINAFTAVHKALEAAVGTPHAPGQLATAMLGDLDVVVPAHRRASDADSQRRRSAAEVDVCAGTIAWFKLTAGRLCTINQPRSGEEGESADTTSLLWNSRNSLWTLLERTLATPGMLLDALDAQWVNGGSTAFDSIFCANLNSLRETSAELLHTFQKHVLVQMAKLRAEGMISRLGDMGGELARLKVVCKVLHTVRRDVTEGAVKRFEALMRLQNRTVVLAQLEHELRTSLLPALRKEVGKIVPAGTSAQLCKSPLWSAPAVAEEAGERLVALVAEALVDVRMKSGECCVEDRLQALFQHVKSPEEVRAPSFAESRGASESGLEDVERSLSELNVGYLQGTPQGAEYGSDDSDREDVIDDAEFNYARQSHLVHIEAAKAMRKEGG